MTMTTGDDRNQCMLNIQHALSQFYDPKVSSEDRRKHEHYLIRIESSTDSWSIAQTLFTLSSHDHDPQHQHQIILIHFFATRILYENALQRDFFTNYHAKLQLLWDILTRVCKTTGDNHQEIRIKLAVAFIVLYLRFSPSPENNESSEDGNFLLMLNNIADASSSTSNAAIRAHIEVLLLMYLPEEVLTNPRIRLSKSLRQYRVHQIMSIAPQVYSRLTQRYIQGIHNIHHHEIGVPTTSVLSQCFAIWVEHSRVFPPAAEMMLHNPFFQQTYQNYFPAAIHAILDTPVIVNLSGDYFHLVDRMVLHLCNYYRDHPELQQVLDHPTLAVEEFIQSFGHAFTRYLEYHQETPQFRLALELMLCVSRQSKSCQVFPIWSSYFQHMDRESPFPSGFDQPFLNTLLSQSMYPDAPYALELQSQEYEDWYGYREELRRFLRQEMASSFWKSTFIQLTFQTLEKDDIHWKEIESCLHALSAILIKKCFSNDEMATVLPSLLQCLMKKLPLPLHPALVCIQGLLLSNLGPFMTPEMFPCILQSIQRCFCFPEIGPEFEMRSKQDHVGLVILVKLAQSPDCVSLFLQQDRWIDELIEFYCTQVKAWKENHSSRRVLEEHSLLVLCQVILEFIQSLSSHARRQQYIVEGLVPFWMHQLSNPTSFSFFMMMIEHWQVLVTATTTVTLKKKNFGESQDSWVDHFCSICTIEGEWPFMYLLHQWKSDEARFEALVCSIMSPSFILLSSSNEFTHLSRLSEFVQQVHQHFRYACCITVFEHLVHLVVRMNNHPVKNLSSTILSYLYPMYFQKDHMTKPTTPAEWTALVSFIKRIGTFWVISDSPYSSSPSLQSLDHQVGSRFLHSLLTEHVFQAPMPTSSILSLVQCIGEWLSQPQHHPLVYSLFTLAMGEELENTEDSASGVRLATKPTGDFGVRLLAKLLHWTQVTDARSSFLDQIITCLLSLYRGQRQVFRHSLVLFFQLETDFPRPSTRVHQNQAAFASALVSHCEQWTLTGCPKIKRKLIRLVTSFCGRLKP